MPELVPALKRRIDERRDVSGQFLITGSQQWGVMRTLAESLAGRVVFLDLEGFSLLEIAESNSVPWLHAWLGSDAVHQRYSCERLPSTPAEHVWRGFFPEAQQLPVDLVSDFLGGYLRTYIERDVRVLADVSDLSLFARFVRLCSALTAQEISFSQLGRELGVTPQTAKRWLELLGASFQWFESPAYSGNTIKRVSGKPKGYVADSGLGCALQAISEPVALQGHPFWGAMFETAVVAEIRKALKLLSPTSRMFHWRARGGAEIDVLIERNGIVFPIEIKAKSNPGRRDARSFQSFRDTYPNLQIAPGLIVAPAREFRAITEHDYLMPWNAAVAENQPR